MSASTNDHDQSIDIDEIEEFLSQEDAKQPIDTESERSIGSSDTRLVTQQCPSSSSITQAQRVSLSLEKSLSNMEENSVNDKSRISMSNSKTSNVPGPVGLLPILKTAEELKRLKEDKVARDALPTNEENANGKRPKTTADLFSLNIDNYPSYAIALRQLQESFSCEPISINTALVKARLGIKKRIPLMCAAVTHYDRQENTILLDKSAHIRATFIGDDELLDSFNIRIGHTLVLRNVAVFTSTRHRHHYVNIHIQNIIAIQDPLNDLFSMPLLNQEQPPQKSILHSIENEISAYEDTTKINNETFQIFSQSDHEDDEQPPLKKLNINSKSSTTSGFNHIKPSAGSSSSANKFKETIGQKASSSIQPQNNLAATSSVISNVKIPNPTTVTPRSSVTEVDLLKMIDRPIDVGLDEEVTDIDNDELFGSW